MSETNSRVSYETFIAELKQFCLDRGFEIAGTCESEGIYGEITVIRRGEPSGWLAWKVNLFNFVEGPPR